MNNNLKLQKRALLLFLAALTPPIFSTQSEVSLNEEELSEQEDLDEEDDFDDNEDENNDEAEKASKLAIVKHLVKKYGLPSAVVAALMTGSFFAGKSSGSKKSVAAPVNVEGKDFATTLATLEEATKLSTDKLVKKEEYSYDVQLNSSLQEDGQKIIIAYKENTSFFVPNHAQTTPTPVGWFKKAEPTLHDKGVTEIDKTFNELVAIVDAKIARGQDILKSLNSDLYNEEYTRLFELEIEVIQYLRTIAINFDLSGKSLEASVSKLNNLNTEFAQSIDAVIKAKFAKDSAFANQELFEVNAQAKDKAINLQQWPAVINNRISSLRQEIKMFEAARKKAKESLKQTKELLKKNIDSKDQHIVLDQTNEYESLAKEKAAVMEHISLSWLNKEKAILTSEINKLEAGAKKAALQKRLATVDAKLKAIEARIEAARAAEVARAEANREAERARAEANREAERLAQQQAEGERAKLALNNAIEQLTNLTDAKNLLPILTSLGASQEIKAAAAAAADPRETIATHLDLDQTGKVVFKPGLVEALNNLPKREVSLPDGK